MDIPQEPVIPNIEDDNIIKCLLENDYGLAALSIKCLNGYYDKNYHVTVDAKHTNPHLDSTCGNGYLVKIVNHLNSNLPDFQIESREKDARTSKPSTTISMGQKKVMDQLNSSGIQCQEEIKTIAGYYFSTLTVPKDGEKITHMVSVRTFLDGDILNNVTLTSDLAYEVGVLTAGICRGLQSLDFEFHNDLPPLWSMENFFKVKRVLHAVKDTARKQVAEEVFAAFDAIVVPRKSKFRKGMIHGDISEQNILVKESTSGHYQICGLLDYEHSCKSYCVYDLAIAMAYMMMVAKMQIPVLDVGGHVLSGYEKLSQLNDAERDSLKTLVASRMVMSLVYGAYFHMLNPSNEYALATSKAGWSSLLEFWKTDEIAILKKWDEVGKSHIKL